MLRRTLLAASGSAAVRTVVTRAPVSRSVVRRFVSGEQVDDAVDTARQLLRDGLQVSLDHLGEQTTDRATARSAVDAYLVLLERLSAAGLTAGGGAEVSVKLSAVGQALDEDLALASAREICAAAAAAGTTVTLDMEDSSTTDSTLRILAALRRDHPSTGAVLQAYLHRTEDDCRALSGPGSRVRLCKGAYREPPEVAYTRPVEVDASYARCLEVLMAGDGYPMVATHDPRLIAVAERLAAGRPEGSYEHQMLFGVRPREQRRLVAAGRRVRVYVPYGDEWYGYLVRRLAERPANLVFFLRALVGRS
ncbi:MAG: proline dehydrogenase family protein [Actinomycetota bacterium]|nr:proline dehydrogenase family protein [Actinomycetota bacterium]